MKKLLAWLMAVTLTVQLVTPVFAEEIEETQTATEAVEVETEAPVTEVPTTEPPVPETAAPEETSAPTESQATEVTETTASTEETTSAVTEPTEEVLDLFDQDENNEFSTATLALQDAPDSSSEEWLWPVPDNPTIYSPFNLGNDYLINKRGSEHWGIDISRNADLPIVASRTGVVAFVQNTGYNDTSKNSNQSASTCRIVLKHDINGKTYYSFYLHIKSGTILYYSDLNGHASGSAISVGDVIPQGTKIGITGNTGMSYGTHLHFGLSTQHSGGWVSNKSYINPNPTNSGSITSNNKRTYSNTDILGYPSSYGAGIHYTISGSSGHTHNYVTEYEEAHPHKEYKKCYACGDWYYTGATKTVDGCSDCHPMVYLDLNGYLDGRDFGSLEDYGTCDVYIDGVKAADDCADFVKYYPVGTTYSIEDIRATNGHQYIGEKADLRDEAGNTGVSFGSTLSGTLTKNQEVILEFKTINQGGKCGDNLTWALDGSGVLTISGSGDMKTSYRSAWYSNRAKILSVVIEPGVTNIGNYAFYDCSNLTSVTIPDSVTSIGECAFWGCGLTSVTIPESVTKIEGGTFYGCTKLESVTLPEGSLSIENAEYSSGIYYGAFENCTSLTSVTIPKSVTSIGDYAFYGCSSLTSVTIPEGVTSIGDYAFSGCNKLTSVTISEGVMSIGGRAFSGCSGLTSVTIPEGVTSIGDYAFWHCSSLTSVTIPKSVTSIGLAAFCGCSSLTSVTIPEGVTSIGDSAFYGCSSLTSVTIPDSVTSIDESAFSHCSSLTSVTIPEAVTSIGDFAFSCCSSLGTITVANGNEDYASVDGVLFNKECTTLVCYPARHGAAYQIPEGVTSIGYSAFSGCSSLTSVTIPEGVTKIEGGTFYDCTKLESVTLPEGLLSIGYVEVYGAFENCTSLKNIEIPDSVTSIGDDAFQDCESLTSVALPRSVTSIGDSAFYGCSSLTSVTIPEGVTSIGDSAFYGCCSLTSVSIPEGVTSIGYGAFSDCSSLTSVTIPESVTSIVWYAFSDCSSLTSVTIPEGVTSIDSGAFWGCSSLISVTIPKSVTSISERAFYGCDAITDVYYSGTEEEWQAIEMGDYNDALSDATIHYNYVHIHNLEHIPGKTATCTEAGNLEYWHCLVCDEYFADADCTQVIREADMVLPALGHDMTKVEAAAPTYAATGNNEYYTCSRCGKAFKDEQGEIETTVEAETLPKLDKGTEIRPVDTSTLSSGRKLTLTAWTLPDNKKVKVKWSLSEDSKAYASISSSGVLTAKNVNEVQNITVIADPTDGSPEARKEIQILPKITVKQVEKFNLFHSYSRVELAITGGKVDCALLDGNKDFVLENENDHFYIRFADPENPPAKPNTRATLQVFFPGSDTPATKALTISTTNTAPKLKLNPTSSILNTKLIDGLTVEAEVLGTEDESLEARSTTKGVTASIKSGKLVVTLDTQKTTTATIYLKGNDWAKEVKLTHRITVTEKKPTVKFSAKGKLDVLNPASEIVYTPKLTNAAGTITDVQLTGEDAKLFNAEVVDGLVHLKLAKSGKDYSTKKTYKVMPVVTLLGKDITGPTLSVKVTQSTMKLAKIPNQTVSKSSPEDLTVNIKITSPLTAEIGDVQLNAKTTAALRNALAAAGGIHFEADTVTFPAAAFTDLKPGRYTVILDVFPANAASDTKPIQAKFTLTVQK